MFGVLSLSPVGWAVGSAVLHFLWQGALIGLVAAAVLGLMRGRSAAQRYAVALAALGLCLLCFLASFALALTDASMGADPGALSVPFTTTAFAADLTAGGAPAHLAAWFWAVGVLCMALRIGLQGQAAQRFRTTAVGAASSRWQHIFGELKAELGVSRGVRLLRSGLAEVPMVVGWFRPLVLVPAAAFTGLSTDQLRALLAHELAHIRRHDHLLNAAQAVIETVLFFHPVVWWISKQVRLEREYCCDDSAVRMTGDPRILAEALAAMAALRIDRPLTQLALAATGGTLMQRITRILGVRPVTRTLSAGWQLPAGLVLAGVLAFTGSTYAASVQGTDGKPVVQDAGRADVKQGDKRKSEEIKRKQEMRSQDLRAQGEKVRAELNGAVKSGRITQAQADERFAAWKSEATKKEDVRARLQDQLKAVRAELDAAVKSGRITQAQADERLAGWKKRVEIGTGTRAALADVRAELDAAVKAGKLTQAQADEKFAGYRKKLGNRRVASDRADPEAVIKKIQAAVEAGEVTPEQGKQRIEAYRKSLADRKAEQAAAFDRAKIEIDAAVKAGKLTPAEGQAKLDEIKQRQTAGNRLKVENKKR